MDGTFASTNTLEGSMLEGVVALFERHLVPYCVPHGFHRYPMRVGNEVDMIVDPSWTARNLERLLSIEAGSFGARLVRARGRHFMLSARRADGSHAFLTLDIDTDSRFGSISFFSASEMLQGTRTHAGIRVPTVPMEFGHYLARCLARGISDPARLRRLADLFAHDPEGCSIALDRLLTNPDKQRVSAAISCGSAKPSEWQAVGQRMMSRLAMRQPAGFLLRRARWLVEKGYNLLNPDGLAVVVLGPDGAGKSSTTDSLSAGALMPVFDRSVCQGFVPPLHRLIGRNHGPSSEPHALAPRPLLHSLLRCGYWLGYSLIDQVRVRITKARGGIVLYDRHMADVLVDPKRYRYSGPAWPIRLVWALVPKPDLLVVLDAPAEVIQARKQEVPFEETVRQVLSYRGLAQSLPFGRIVDGSQPFACVVQEINELILQFLERRIASRLVQVT